MTSYDCYLESAAEEAADCIVVPAEITFWLY